MYILYANLSPKLDLDSELQRFDLRACHQDEAVFNVVVSLSSKSTLYLRVALGFSSFLAVD